MPLQVQSRRRSVRLVPLSVLASLLLLYCGHIDSEPVAPVVQADPPPTVGMVADADPAPDTEPPGDLKVAFPDCGHRPPFSFPSDEPEAVLPAPFDKYSRCDVLAALFADYQRDASTSAVAGGPVRVDRVKRWDVRGRQLLAVLFYTGDQVEEMFICGGCRVRARFAVVEIEDDSLSQVGKPLTFWHPGPDALALFRGRGEFEEVTYELLGDDVLLGVRIPWSTGMPGYWEELNLIRVDGDKLINVFHSQVSWYAFGHGRDYDEWIASKVASQHKHGAVRDLVVTTTRTHCTYTGDTSIGPGATLHPELERLCSKPKLVGKQRWRFDGARFSRIKGKPPPQPLLLKKMWGW